MHFDGADGTNQVTDDTGFGAPKVFTPRGAAKIRTAKSKMGGASAYFDCIAAASFTTPDHDDWTLDGDFTLEIWFNADADAPQVFDNWISTWGNGRNGWNWGGPDDPHSGNPDRMIFEAKAGAQEKLFGSDAAIAPVTEAWHHAAVVRSGTTPIECAGDFGSSTPCCGQEGTGEVELAFQCPETRPTCTGYEFGRSWGDCSPNLVTMYLDGTAAGSETIAGTINGGKLGIGSRPDGSQCFKGYIDELRISNVARYVENFVPGQDHGVAGAAIEPFGVTSVMAWSGEPLTFRVPLGVSTIKVKAWGAGGGGGSCAATNRGGGGGFATATIAVTGGEGLRVVVGKGGNSPNSCGGGSIVAWPENYGNGNYRHGANAEDGANTSDPDGGGGAGDTGHHGAGGGFSGVFRNPEMIVNQQSALLIAGGGGGAAHDNDGNPGSQGGAGGGEAGGNPSCVAEPCAVDNNVGFGATQTGVGGNNRGRAGGYALQVPGLQGDSSEDDGRGDSRYHLQGGGGGGGYWGGAAGVGEAPRSSGGGGSGYLSGEVSAASLRAGNGPNPSDADDAAYVAGSGVGGTYNEHGGNGLVVISYTGAPDPSVLLLDGGATDASGSGHAVPGTLTATTAAGYEGKGYEFTGADGAGPKIASHADFQFGTSDFEISFWFKRTGVSGSGGISYLFSQCHVDSMANKVGLLIKENTVRYNADNMDRIISTTPIDLNAWYFLKLARTQGTTTLYLDDVGEGTYADSLIYEAADITLGQYGDTCPNPNLGFKGYMDDLKVTKGQARCRLTGEPCSDACPDCTCAGTAQNPDVAACCKYIAQANYKNGLTTVCCEKGFVTAGDGSACTPSPGVQGDFCALYGNDGTHRCRTITCELEVPANQLGTHCCTDKPRSNPATWIIPRNKQCCPRGFEKFGVTANPADGSVCGPRGTEVWQCHFWGNDGKNQACWPY